jgi:hypothetical protein
MSSRSWILVALVGLTGTARADDGLGDIMTPRELAVGEALRGGATGSAAIGMNPAGLPLNRELVFEGGYGYRESDSASLIGVSACDSTNAMPGCFFYNYAGSSPDLDGMSGTRRTHIGGMALSRQFLPRVMIGATTKYYSFDSTMTGEEDHSGVLFDLGTTLRLTELISAGFVAQNLYGTERSPQFPRTLGGGVMMHPIPQLGMSFDMRWRVEGEATRARYGGGLEYFAKSGGSGFPLRVGGLRDENTSATYVTGGLGFATMKYGLDVGAQKQVKNGDDLLIVASLRFFGPRFANPGIE